MFYELINRRGRMGGDEWRESNWGKMAPLFSASSE